MRAQRIKTSKRSSLVSRQKAKGADAGGKAGVVVVLGKFSCEYLNVSMNWEARASTKKTLDYRRCAK